MTVAVRPPIHYDTSRAAWVITSYDEAHRLLRTPGWSSDPANNRALVELSGGVPPLVGRTLLFMDAPGHTRLRRLVGPSFGAGRITALRPRIRAIVDAALDGLAGRDRFDLLDCLAYVVPVAVIAELLDVGTEGARLIRREAPRLIGQLEIDPSVEQLLASAEAAITCAAYLLPEITRGRPDDDFIGALLAAEADGERLDVDDVLATVLLLLMAGHETSANLIANGTLRLLENRDQYDLLRAHPELVPAAVDETLRADSPVKLVGRTAITDHTIAGRHIRAGEVALVDLAAANHDPSRYDDPARFDVRRPQAPHLAFGAGAHFCLGWALARAETEETLAGLIARYPDLALAGPPRWRESGTFHALERLDVTTGGA